MAALAPFAVVDEAVDLGDAAPMHTLYTTMIAPLILAAGIPGADAGSEPAFSIPRHFVCSGVNESGDEVAASVTIEGDRKTNNLLIAFKGNLEWPKSSLVVSNTRPQFFDNEETSIWFWYSTFLEIDGERAGFGFDVSVDGQVAALRFSRQRFAMNLEKQTWDPDPMGAYGDMVRCTPVDPGAEIEAN